MMEACGQDYFHLAELGEKPAWEVFTYMTYKSEREKYLHDLKRRNIQSGNS